MAQTSKNRHSVIEGRRARQCVTMLSSAWLIHETSTGKTRQEYPGASICARQNLCDGMQTRRRLPGWSPLAAYLPRGISGCGLQEIVI